MKRASLACCGVLLLVAGNGFAQSSANVQKTWNNVIINKEAVRKIVFDNDNIKDFVKDTDIYDQGVVWPEESPKKVPAARGAAVGESRKGLKRFTIEIGFCGGVYPTWCPRSGEGVEGRTITVEEDDEVEVTIINDFYGWRDREGQIRGQAVSFVLTAAEPIEACFQQPIPISQRENCRKFPQFGVSQFLQYGAAVVRFTASERGRFKYYDGFHRSGFGWLIVK